MKYNKALLVFSTLLAAIVVSCSKDVIPSETTSKDKNLAGVNVAVGETSGPFHKLFVLNEGKMGTNNASLDFFRFSDGMYVRNAFHQMNPDQVLGLGDIGNDIAVYNNLLWLSINNSGLLEIVNPEDETHVATIRIPSPRKITFYEKYAYVTSYSGAYYGGPDRLGSVYKISTETFEVTDSLQVGYQPEGIVANGGMLYVANSGGLKSDYSYDNRVSVIDISTFKLVKEFRTVKNIQNIIVSGNTLWLNTYGDYVTTQSGVWQVDLKSGNLTQGGELSKVRSRCGFISAGNMIYTIENVYSADYSVSENKLYTINMDNGRVSSRTLDKRIKIAYGLYVNPSNGDIYIGDAIDYVNPGKVYCLDSDLNIKWSAVAGVDPAHFALWER